MIFLFLLVTKLVASPLESGNQPSQALVEVLDTFGVGHSSWDEIVRETQKKWLRGNEERWKAAQKEDLHPEKTYALFSQLGMTGTVQSAQKEYDAAVILGSTRPRMEMHIRFLKEEWKRGVRFKEIVFLVGDRPSDPAVDGNEGKNETELAKIIYEKEALKEWRALPVLFVDTPRKSGQKRPTTVDTFEYWLKMNPKPGNVLVISGQPFIARQDLIARKTLPSTFQVETVGGGFTLEEYEHHPRGLPILLDELARRIYEERGGC